MMSSAVTFLNNGPDSLAYQLSRAGYDVWLGNSRGSGMSTTPHDTLHPVNNNKEFWGFTWADIGDYDVPAAIEFILDQTEMEDLTYIGHSMGTTQMFSALTTANERQFLKEHVNLFVALGPVVYMENIEGPLKLLSDHVEEVETAASLLKVRKLGSYD
mmetsp:Transcript_64086/g.88629  ORF Transcript_64086/g.88629 Transcript_64086/m.88629 type:complete len:158 (-) Transcript_64086:187-660(-)